MPYVGQKRRKKIFRKYDNDAIQVDGGHIFVDDIETAGELQYAMAEMFKSFVERKGTCYQTMNDVLGAIAGAKMEFYRRKVVPYEDEKIEENGDV